MHPAHRAWSQNGPNVDILETARARGRLRAGPGHREWAWGLYTASACGKEAVRMHFTSASGDLPESAL